jgi:membrane associated rhomboid family serine protease
LIPLKDDISTRRFPVLTVGLIVANVVMFFVFQGAFIHDSDFFNQRVVDYGAIPFEVAHPGQYCGVRASDIVCGVSHDGQPSTWLTILTSMFMHGGLLHLAGNMLFLWIFGNNIEDSMGRGRFIAFYLLGGLVAVLAQTFMEPNAATPTIGASGAVAAVLGGYALLYPRARVVTLVFIIIFFTILEVPALLVLGAWFALQLLDAVSSLSQPVGEQAGGVAYFAHIGGFGFGLLFIKLFANRVHEDYERAHRTPVY